MAKHCQIDEMRQEDLEPSMRALVGMKSEIANIQALASERKVAGSLVAHPKRWLVSP